MLCLVTPLALLCARGGGHRSLSLASRSRARRARGGAPAAVRAVCVNLKTCVEPSPGAEERSRGSSKFGAAGRLPRPRARRRITVAIDRLWHLGARRVGVHAPRHERQHRRRALSIESASSAAAAAASSPPAATAALRQQQRRYGVRERMGAASASAAATGAVATAAAELVASARRCRQSRSWGVDGPAVAPSAHASAATAGATGSTGTPISRRTSRSAGIRQKRRHRPPQSSPTTRTSSPPPLNMMELLTRAPALSPGQQGRNGRSYSAPRQRLLSHRARPTASRQRGSRSREASGPGAPALRLHREATGRMV